MTCETWLYFVALLTTRSNFKKYTAGYGYLNPSISHLVQLSQPTCLQVQLALFPILEHESLVLGIDPLISMMNHSCGPHAGLLSEGACVRVRTLQPIAAREEITIAYIDNTVPKRIRQSDLKHKWLFDCACKQELSTFEVCGLAVSATHDNSVRSQMQ